MTDRKKLALLILLVFGFPFIAIGVAARFVFLATQVGWWWVEDVYVEVD